MAETDEQLRAKLDQAMIYAPSKWGAYVNRVAQAYAAAYQNQAAVLNQINAQKQAEAAFASFVVSVILPSLVGGFIGAIISGKGKQAIDALTSQSAKFKWGMAVDMTKTVASDMAKAEVRTEYQHIVDSSAWKPTSISPDAFQSAVQSSILEFMTAAADALNDSRKGRSKAKYRDVVSGLYYGTFVREAPETKDLWTVNELSPVLEIFLWVDWANHRDTKWWLERITRVTDGSSILGSLDPDDSPIEQLRKAKNVVADDLAFNRSASDVIALNPILERLVACKVNRDYITQGIANRSSIAPGIPALDGYRFLNILWVRHIAPHYTGTLLGELLQRLADKSKVPVPIYRRPRSYRLM
jgi:hypothetical protein